MVANAWVTASIPLVCTFSAPREGLREAMEAVWAISVRILTPQTVYDIALSIHRLSSRSWAFQINIYMYSAMRSDIVETAWLVQKT